MKKGFVKKIAPYFLVMVFTTTAFFATRLINLTIIPIFTDEAIYLRWAQIALADPRWRFISLIDGKQPLLIWLFLPAIKVIADPLVAGRLVSVILGFSAMVGLSVFGWYMTKSWKGAFVGGLVYILVPFFLMYDRLALYEALLVSVSIWTLFLTYLFAQKQRLDTALLLGTAIGVGLLTKSSANFFWILLPVTLFIIEWPKQKRLETLAKWIGLSLVVIIQSQIYNNILRLSEFRHFVGQKNLSFVYSLSEFLENPFRSVYGNLIGLSNWLVTYLTLPLTLIMVVAMTWFTKRNWRQGIFFLSFFAVPFFALAFFGKVIYPRFLLFMIVPLIIPTIVFLENGWNKYSKQSLFLVIGLFLLLPVVIFNIKLITDPIHAPLPLADRQQFINDWPAGYGIKEVISYLERESENGSIIVGTEGTFGLFPMALELYLGKNSNVTFRAYWPVSEFPEELRFYSQKQPTFLIFKEKQDIPKEWPLQLIQAYQRGDGPTYLKFYRVIP